MKLHEEFKLYENMWEDTTKLQEAVEDEYYLEVRAYTEDTVEEYDDEDNAGVTSEYGYWGTKQEIIDKLNHIAETCTFSFVFIYIGDPLDNNCVFNASDVDTTTDEEFDNPVIWMNNFVTSSEPFMKDFITEKDIKSLTESGSNSFAELKMLS